MERSLSLGCLIAGALSLAVMAGCTSDAGSTRGNQGTGGGTAGAGVGSGGAGGGVAAAGSGGTTDTSTAGTSDVTDASAAGTGGNQIVPDAEPAADAPPSDSGAGGTVADPGTDGDGVFPIAAPFKADPDMTDRPGVAQGKTIQFQMGNSKTFGDGGRAAAVYLPAGYVSGTEVPFMVAQDGLGFSGDIRPLLDNMIADGQLPAMAIVFADPGGDRSNEYDTASDKYYQFVETELLPEAIAQVMMQTNLVLNLTKDPEGRGTYGGSSGGAAAFTMGWFHPESYRRLLTISGSFVDLGHPTPGFPKSCADYHNSVIAASPVKPLRVFLEAGSNDLVAAGQSWRAADDAMAMVLKDKGYHYRYVTAQGASHEDAGARHQYLPAAMLWLWRGYPITKP